MEKWVITCNPKNYDVIGAFSAFDRINWKQSVDIQPGDIVYIYVGKPLSSIKYETKAVKVNLPKAMIDDSDYVIDGSNYENYGRYMELQLLREFGDDVLPYNLLMEQDLKTVQGPSRISTELEEFIMNRTSQLKRLSNSRYFFVFQNKSFNEEYNGGYMWAPQYGDDGRKVSHWDQMKEVRKGDVIIHSYMKKIVAISIAKTDVYEFDRPVELPNQWNDKGWRVDTEYYIINNPIVTSDHMEKLMELQPESNAPFNRIGKNNTGYLFAANRKMAEYIIKQSASIQNADFEKKILLTFLKKKDDNSIESKLDQELFDEIDELLTTSLVQGVEYTPEPKKKPEAQITSGNKTYPRDRKTSINALTRAKHNCEIDEKHPSFIRRNTNTNYAEPHHLIPMAYQNLFENSLDVEANIVSMCSNCHNQIHYGVGSEKLIEDLYKKRKEELEQAGLAMSLKDLLELY